MLTRAQKEADLALLKESVAKAAALIAVDYRGMNVDEVNDLRSKLRQAEGEIQYRVAKNTLLRLAVDGTDCAPASPHFTGPTAVAIATEDASTMARILVDFAKDCEKLEIKGGVVDGEAADMAMIEALAKLPTKDELRGMLAGTLQAPLRNLAGTLNGLLSSVRNALDARKNQLEGA